MARGTTFDQFRVTNGHVAFIDPDTSERGEQYDIECTGSLSVDSETKTISKVCEGIVTDEISVIESMAVDLSGHMPVEVLRNVYGISTDGNIEGVYSFNRDSRGQVGTWTWDITSPFQTDRKLIAFPRLSVQGGLSWSLENGGDEVAEVEISFSALPDERGNFYYEAMESEVDTTVVNKWHKEFSTELVEGVPSV